MKKTETLQWNVSAPPSHLMCKKHSCCALLQLRWRYLNFCRLYSASSTLFFHVGAYCHAPAGIIVSPACVLEIAAVLSSMFFFFFSSSWLDCFICEWATTGRRHRNILLTGLFMAKTRILRHRASKARVNSLSRNKTSASVGVADSRLYAPCASCKHSVVRRKIVLRFDTRSAWVQAITELVSLQDTSPALWRPKYFIMKSNKPAEITTTANIFPDQEPAAAAAAVKMHQKIFQKSHNGRCKFYFLM